ncbi:hypothetical protein BKA82DRAFT_16995 [Pisolithus tinctorius]|uniref:Uncharacterized protein n=1 Tax=Pisolithus tinctorius Marx 270 TaxID=870435 RepID=A0A0C3NJQ7_PISTI|nr:hypothetical protein BKA82DRAFT_16995 [Pisolithus tinctorius]KIN95885.1 hypothetical protein M404DRAFT_16995 [Pisolithus tinctorius Marx 270]
MTTTICVNTVPTAGGFELDPLCFTIHFTGSAQSLAVPEHLHIQISIHVPDEFLGQISPMISEYSNPQAQPTPSHPQYVNLTLVHQIQFHLIQPKDDLTWEEHVMECLLVQEFFWMAFVAAFPSFPYRNWPNWNPRISMDGNFILYWISDTDVGSVKPESVGKIQEFIWEELKVLMVNVLPPHIVSEFLA